MCGIQHFCRCGIGSHTRLLVIIVQPCFIEKPIRSYRKNIFRQAVCPAQLLQYFLSFDMEYFM